MYHYKYQNTSKQVLEKTRVLGPELINGSEAAELRKLLVQRAGAHRPRVYKVVAGGVLHHAHVSIEVDELDRAARRAASVPDRVGDLTADVARQRTQATQAWHGSRRRVLDLFGVRVGVRVGVGVGVRGSGVLDLHLDLAFDELCRRCGDDAAAEGGEELPEAEEGDGGEREQVGVELRVEHALRRLDRLGDAAWMGLGLGFGLG
eukprot:scaffold25795_cov51-Phaeocystis_antarctica.AAC.3